MVDKSKIHKFLDIALTAVAALTALFYLYTAYFGQRGMLVQRGILITVCIVLTLFYKPMSQKSPHGWTRIVDFFLALTAIAGMVYIMNREAVFQSIKLPTSLDIVIGGVVFVLLCEVVRRHIGLPVIILIAVFILYVMFGRSVPGLLHHRGFDLWYIINYAVVSFDGIFGPILYVVTTVVVMFVLFSALLRESGADLLFSDMPYALLGRSRGGPAKLAVVGSSLFGMISGSAVANVVATGTFTIPLMKRSGYRPIMAGAVETMSSSGGQIMPPVMGAAAFIMAELLGVSYWTVCIAAFLPAVLYYVSLFAIVDLEALKCGLHGLPASELPSLRKTLARGWFLIVPIIVLVYLLAQGWSPMKVCFFTIVTTLVVTLPSKELRLGPRRLYKALSQGIKDMMMITVVCASMGLIVGLLSLTGLGLRMSTILVELSGGNLMVLLVLTMITSIVLGTGLSTTACYIFLALLVAPALMQMGVPPLAAHLFILHYGAFSSITPPAGGAFFAAAAIAQVPPMGVGFLAWRLALISFFVPFFFVYNPALILQSTMGDIVLSSATAIIGVMGFAFMMQGYFLTRASIPERILLGAGGFAMLYPSLIIKLIGAVLLTIGFISQFIKWRKKGRAELKC